MIGFTDAIANQLLNQIFGTGPAYVAPSTVYIALTTVEPTNADTGSTIVEVAYTGYARKALAVTNLTAAANREKSNTLSITFPQALSAGNAEVGWACLLSAVTLGTLIMVGPLGSPMEIVTGDVPTLNIGALALVLP